MNFSSRVKFVYAVLIAVLAFGAFAAPSAYAAPKGPTVLDVAKAVNADSGEFSILIAAINAADPSVARTLGGNGQFTVFAPTDAAFVSLLGELGLTADDVLGNQALVTQVLLYHVARGNRDYADILDSSRIRTLERGFLFQSGGVLTDANGRTANIIAHDVKASNGVIHVIDRVVLP
jgi:transforming growth factor-beta-induced protein